MDVGGVNQELRRDGETAGLVQHDQKVVDVGPMLEEENVHLEGVPNLLLLFQRYHHRWFAELALLAFITFELFSDGQHLWVGVSSGQSLDQSSVARMSTSSMKLEHGEGKSFKFLRRHGLERLPVNLHGVQGEDGVVGLVVGQHAFGSRCAKLNCVETCFSCCSSTHRWHMSVAAITLSFQRMEHTIAVCSHCPGLLMEPFMTSEVEHAAVEVVVHKVHSLPKTSNLRQMPPIIVSWPFPSHISTSVDIVQADLIAVSYELPALLPPLHTFQPSIFCELIEVLNGAIGPARIGNPDPSWFPHLDDLLDLLASRSLHQVTAVEQTSTLSSASKLLDSLCEKAVLLAA